MALVVAILGFTAEAPAITAPEVFNDGKRAFANARWIESEECFSRFLEVWPDHRLKNEALYYRTIASIRSQPDKEQKARSHNIEVWNQNLQALAKEFPTRDLSELKTAINIAGSTRPVAWSELANLSPAEMKHYLNREWHPQPNANPVQLLQWSSTWLKKHTKANLEPDLIGKISLLNSRALWQISLSPLSIQPNSDILKVCGYWPVHTSLEKELNAAFANGSPAVKREAALLGYHFDFLRTGKFVHTADKPVPTGSKWYSYLSERGIHLQEAWCPR